MTANSPCGWPTSSGVQPARCRQLLASRCRRGELHRTESSPSSKSIDMIVDPSSGEFVSGFVHQWLDMERLDFFQFDVALLSRVR